MSSTDPISEPVKPSIVTSVADIPVCPSLDAPIREWVHFYRDLLGFNVIPVIAKSKKAAVEWTKYQNSRASAEEVDQWLKTGLFENIAVLAGETSGNLTVIDFDDMEGYKRAFDSTKIENETLVVRSGSGRGVHVYLRGEKSVKTVRCEHLEPPFGIQGQNVIVILPPSIHLDSGQPYKIISQETRPMEVDQIEEGLARLMGRLGVEGRKTLSMREVVKGLQQGSRETNMFRLAWYLLHIPKLLPDQAWKELQERNKLNIPPLDESELKHAFDIARKTGRAQELDKMEKDEFDEELEPSPEDYELAKRVLRSPHALQIIKILLDQSIRREGRNKVYSFLVTLTAKHPNPKLKQILMLSGQPGGGKTTIANVLAKLLRTKRVGRYSEHAMDYSNLEKYDLLYVQELLDLEQQKRMGVSTIRFLSADDQGYTVEFTTGDPKQGFTTKTRKIPAMSVITTTTVSETEAQFERRIHRVNVDETAATTKAVIAWKGDEKKRAVFEWLGDIPARRGVYVLKALVEQLEPYEVSTAPVSRGLGDILKTTYLRARGDYDKILALTEMSAWLYQQQRPYIVRTGEHGEERLIFALPQDAYYALEVGLQPILTMMTDLDKRIRDLIRVVGEFKDHNYTYKHGKGLETIPGFTINDILPRVRQAMEAPNIAKRTVRDWLKTLEERGLLAATKPSVENVYTPISGLDEQEAVIKSADCLSAEETKTKFQQEAGNFFSSISTGLPERLLGLTLEDWFDRDELDVNITPLLEQDSLDAPLKVPLKERKDRLIAREMGPLTADKAITVQQKEGLR